MSRTTRTIATGMLAALAPAGAVATRIWTGGDVPDPVPTHWDVHGEVDATMPLDTLFGVCLLASVGLVVVTVLLAARSRADRADRTLVTAGAWATWLAALVFVVPVLASRGAAAAEDVRLGLLALAAVPLVPTVVAVLVWRIQPLERHERTREAASPSTLSLRDGERITWVGRSSSPVLVALAAVLLAAAVFLLFTAWPVANVLALVAVAVFWSHVVTVRVDDRGVTTAWGPMHWPRVVIPLDDVVHARAEEIDPRRWGGWGYRLSRRGTAAVTRRGPGLVLERRDGSLFAATVDGAAEAADLVNALVERELRSRC